MSTGLAEEDIPGAKQDVSEPALQKLKCHKLKFWLQCRGDSCKGLKNQGTADTEVCMQKKKYTTFDAD